LEKLGFNRCFLKRAAPFVDVVMRTPTGGSGMRHCRKSWNYFRGAIEDQIRIETGERLPKELDG
jgi:hypothetical protein